MAAASAGITRHFPWSAVVAGEQITFRLMTPDDREAALRGGHLRWTRHLGELRVMVSPETRGKGIGKLLAKEVFAVAHDVGMRRIIARLTSKQTSARHLFSIRLSHRGGAGRLCHRQRRPDAGHGVHVI